MCVFVCVCVFVCMCVDTTFHLIVENRKSQN